MSGLILASLVNEVSPATLPHAHHQRVWEKPEVQQCLDHTRPTFLNPTPGILSLCPLPIII